VVERARRVCLELEREGALQPGRLRLVAVLRIHVHEPRARHGRVPGERPVIRECGPEPAAHLRPPGPQGGGRGQAALEERGEAMAPRVERAAAEERDERREAARQHRASG